MFNLEEENLERLFCEIKAKNGLIAPDQDQNVYAFFDW